MTEKTQPLDDKTESVDEQVISRGGMTISSFLSARGIKGGTIMLPGSEEDIGSSNARISTASSLLTTEGKRKYSVGRVLARGGMGTILNARDLNIHRSVAMKVMLDPNTQSEDHIVRFIEEAQVTGQLEHPCIVPVHELGLDANGQVFYTMKLVKGINLENILGGIKRGDADIIGKYPLNRLLNVFLKVCDGISFAHHRKVIHRDLKPENIMVGEHGEVLVMDWGLSKVLGKNEANSTYENPGIDKIESLRFGESRNSLKTMDGIVMGTLGFLAPEQARGKGDEIDVRTDIYALGAILYSILALRPPVEGGIIKEILQKTVNGQILPPIELSCSGSFPHCPGNRIPSALSSVAMKALALSIDDRYRSVRELQDDIEAYQSGFATVAENAGLMTQLALLVKRHKTLFATVASAFMVIVVIVTLAFFRINQEKTVALGNEKKALQNLGKFVEEQNARKADRFLAAPALISQAKRMLALKNTENAVRDVDAALNFNPDLAEANLLKGQLLIYGRKYADSVPFLKKYLEQNQKDKNVSELLDLAAEGSERGYSAGLDVKIASVFGRQDLLAQAGELAGSTKNLLEIFGKRINEAWNLPAGTIDGISLSVDNNGFFVLKELFRFKAITKKEKLRLEPLRGMPFKLIDFTGMNHRIEDISPLKGMPLEHLDLSGCRKVANIDALAGCALKELNISGTAVNNISMLDTSRLQVLSIDRTQVTDISVLRGAPLSFLNLTNCKVSSLEALKGAPLQELNLWGVPVSDLAPLRGAPLKNLCLFDTKVYDISPLENMRLERLNLGLLKLKDIHILRGMPLKNLNLYFTMLADLSALKGMELEELNLAGCKVTDIGVLRGMPLRSLSLCPGISNFGPLQGMPLEYLNLGTTDISDISVLKGMQLKYLDLSFTKTNNISLLKGMPLVMLNLSRCNELDDLRSLLECRSLQILVIPEHLKDFAYLRSLKSLKKLDIQGTIGDGWSTMRTVEQFWKDWDAKNPK